jgi:hypothetical protein|tara:strand:+ start:559 stop:1092 length:534 start_codon:yes stop_codon:yes gene_type:complete
MRDADDDRLLLPFQREQQQEETWKKNLRRRRNKKFFSLFACVSFVVFLSISFWFTEENINMEKVFEREDFKGFVKEVRNANAQMRAHEERMNNGNSKDSSSSLRRRTLKDYAAILFTQNLCFDYFVPQGGPYFCLYPVLCFGSDFYSCMTNAGVVQEAYGIDSQSAYSVGNSLLNSF